MASSGDVKYPAVNGPGKVSRVSFPSHHYIRLLTLGMTYSDAFRPLFLLFVLIPGVRIHDDVCITSEDQCNRAIYSCTVFK